MRHSSYSPDGLREYLAYKEDVDRRVAAGHLSDKEGAILCMVRMEGIILEGAGDQRIRKPKCQACGVRVPIIGKTVERFRCFCSPNVEQLIAARSSRHPR